MKKVHKRKNGRVKGARGELEAAKFSSRYNLPDGTPVVAKRMARNGQKGAADLEHNIPGVHFEVKRREGMDVGTKALHEAIWQCEKDAPVNDRPLVLWRRNLRRWCISTLMGNGVIATYDAHEYFTRQLGLRLRDDN